MSMISTSLTQLIGNMFIVYLSSTPELKLQIHFLNHFILHPHLTKVRSNRKHEKQKF